MFDFLTNSVTRAQRLENAEAKVQEFHDTCVRFKGHLMESAEYVAGVARFIIFFVETLEDHPTVYRAVDNVFVDKGGASLRQIKLRCYEVRDTIEPS